MPFRRNVRYASPLVAWHEIELVEPAPEWSDTYRAESARLLIPGSRWIEAEQRGQRFVCDALNALALSPEVPYRTRQPHVAQNSLVLVFHLDEGGLFGGAATVALGPAAQLRLAACRAALDRGAPDALGLEEALLDLLPGSRHGEPTAHGCTGLAAGAGGPVADRGVDPAVERARALLAHDPSASASLHEIARATGVSPFHLARRFKRANGIGLHGYRTRLRMALALARLRDGEDDLSALAFDLGYSSHSHFSASFKSHFGTTPSEARTRLFASAGFR